MKEELIYAFYNQNYSTCLKLCQKALAKKQDKSILELACLCALRLNLPKESLEFAKSAYELKANAYRALNLSKAYALNDDLSQACELLDKLRQKKLQDQSLIIELLKECILTYSRANEHEKVNQVFEELLEIFPQDQELWLEYANFVYAINWEKALSLYQKIDELFSARLAKLQKENCLVENLNVLPVYERELSERLNGIDSSKIGKNNEAIISIHDFIYIKIRPRIALCLFNLYRNEEALKLFTELIPYNQNNSQFWYDFAESLHYSCLYQDSYNAFQKSSAIDNNADSSFRCAYLLLRTRNYDEGIRIYESRLNFAYHSTFSLPHYQQAIQALENDANAFAGKTIAVFCEQGFGDTMMFSTGLYKLCQVAKKVLFLPQSHLFDLFNNALKNIRKENPKLFKNLTVLYNVPSEFDYAVPICSLAYMLKMTYDEFLHLPRPIYPLKRTKNKKKKIALFWNTVMDRNSTFRKNYDLNFILKALEKLPYELISFQIASNGELEQSPLPSYVEDRGSKFTNWQDTYEAFKDIDMLISIDSAIAHLALILKIPTLVLLPVRFDWRWGLLESPKSDFYEDDICLPFESVELTSKKIRAITQEVLGG